MPTDKERLDWLAHKGCVELEHEYLGPVTVMSGFDKLGSGRNMRAAIDAAMRNEKRRMKTARGVQENGNG